MRMANEMDFVMAEFVDAIGSRFRGWETSADVADGTDNGITGFTESRYTHM